MIRIQAGTASSDKCLVCRHCKQVGNESHSASDLSSIVSSQKRNRSYQDPNTTGTRDYSQTQTIQYKSMSDRICAWVLNTAKARRRQTCNTTYKLSCVRNRDLTLASGQGGPGVRSHAAQEAARTHRRAAHQRLETPCSYARVTSSIA